MRVAVQRNPQFHSLILPSDFVSTDASGWAFDRAAAVGSGTGRNRARSRALFDLLDGEAYYSQPIALRHPIVFYEGHLPGFSFNTLVKKALGRPSIDPRLEALFARGIDPHETLRQARHAAGAADGRHDARLAGARRGPCSSPTKPIAG